MNKLFPLAALLLAVVAGACNTGGIRRNPGRIYAPDMTYSRAYDYYNPNPNFEDGYTARLPVMGTVARAKALPDHLVEGDTNAYKTFTTSDRFNAAELAEGKRLFLIHCAICHGPNMDGQGPIYANGKFAALPAPLKDAKYHTMPVGQMYAAIKYGKNAMGSYASQLDTRQRWQVIAYIKKFQSENGGLAFTMGSDVPTGEMNNMRTGGPTGGGNPDSAATGTAPATDPTQTDGSQPASGQPQGAGQRTRQ